MVSINNVSISEKIRVGQRGSLPPAQLAEHPLRSKDEEIKHGSIEHQVTATNASTVLHTLLFHHLDVRESLCAICAFS